MTKIRKNILPAMILLFQLFFLYELICNYNVYVLDPSFRSFSEDYWADFSADGAVKLAAAVELFFKCIFILSFLYRIMRNPNASWKRILLAVLAGFVLYGILMLLFRYFSYHCRLYMTLTDTEILSILLLFQTAQPGLFQKRLP